MTSDRFEKKIKPILQYVGVIGAIFMAIAYIAIVFIMVFGFSSITNISQSLVFATVNAVMGLVIMQFLKVQGIDLAKNLEANQEILKQYNSTKTKDKKFYSLRHFWCTTFIKDLIIKGATIAITTIGIIYIVICGNSNYSWLLLAVVNLFMFACFGLLSLVKAYDFFNERYIPYVMEKLYEADQERIKAESEAAEREAAEREKAIQAEVEKRMAMVEERILKQRYVDSNDRRGIDILESSNCFDPVSLNYKPMVVDSDNDSDSVLVRPANTSNTTSDCLDCAIEENI